MKKVKYLAIAGLVLALSGCNGTTATNSNDNNSSGSSSSGFRVTKIISTSKNDTRTRTTTFSYDSKGRVSTMNISNFDTKEYTAYNDKNLPTKINYIKLKETTELTYDSKGYITLGTFTYSSGSSFSKDSTNTYNGDNIIEIIENPNPTVGNSTRVTKYNYNSKNQIISVIDSNLIETKLEYNSNNQIIKYGKY